MKKTGLFMVVVLLSVCICSSFFIAPNGTNVNAATWTGNWIWQSADGPNNTWLSFRKTVSLNAKPSSAIANIAAENEYWLYVNGQLAVKEGGLQCRPDLTNTYYDQIDIASYLQSGNNTIAVLVWYKGGHNGYTQNMVGKGGLFFECNISGATPSKIVSDSTWKMKANPAFGQSGNLLYLYNRTGSITFNNTTFGGDPCPNQVKSGYYRPAGSTSPWTWCANEGGTYTLSGTCDVAYGLINTQLMPAGDYKWVAWPVSFDARNEIVDWYQTTYSDSAWATATSKGVPPAAPWNDLKPRTIPMWKDYGLTSYQNQSSFPASITANTTITGIVGNNIQGSQYLKVNAPAGVKIKMYMNSYYYVEYYTKAGTQEFDSMVWTNASNSTDEGANTHWAKYEFSNVTGTVQILDLKFHQTSYNTNIVGTFNSSDTNLNTLWTKCKNTSFVCMRDIFFDCPNRERGQWWGDVSEQILYSFYLYDNNANLLAQKGFRELMNSQKADGSLYTTAPGNTFCLPDQNMTAVIALWDYYMYTGDSALLTELYAKVKKYITYLAGIRNSDGMIIQQTSNGWLLWNWIDWGSNMDLQDGSNNTVVNAMFIKLLDAVKGMANVTVNTGDVSYYQGLQDPVKNNFNTYFWNSSSNAYVFHRKNGVQSTCIDDRSNAWAALAGMVDSTRKVRVLDILTQRNDSSPYQERYVEDALFVLNASPQALTRMRSRYASMISSGAASLWEEFPANNSNNHAWSAGPLYLLDAFMLGIRPTGAGYSQYVFQPQLGDVTSVSATIPSVKGNIQASITKSSSVYTQNLTSPANTTAVVAIPKNAFSNYNIGALLSIVVGSTTIWSNGSYTGGAAGISWNSEDTYFVKFNVSPGTYSFKAYPSTSAGPAGYTWCANEDQTYTLSGTCDVAYGANGIFFYKYGVTGSITFNNATFGGDPCYGVAKAGYYKSAGTNPTPTPTPTSTSTPTSAQSPTPTSTTTPTTTPVPAVDKCTGGTISVSNTNSPAGEDMTKAFDNSTSTKWLIGNSTGWIQYDFTGAIAWAINQYTITSANDYATRDPKNWTFQGSNDGTNWTTVDTRTNETFASRFLKKTYSFTNTTAYQMYRLNVTANNGDSLLQMAEIEMFATGSGVIFYQDLNWGGTASQTFGKGTYTMAQLNALGCPDNWMSSLRVPGGWTVIVYQNDNSTGTSWTFTVDSNYVGDACNDQMTSCRIQ